MAGHDLEVREPAPFAIVRVHHFDAAFSDQLLGFVTPERLAGGAHGQETSFRVVRADRIARIVHDELVEVPARLQGGGVRRGRSYLSAAAQAGNDEKGVFRSPRPGAGADFQAGAAKAP